eukprot:TRINITY_DN409_c1_g2_i1.p1 TRINITY_DN409_c1_g2~~TRINITY_DN409_c1_g2_i1.p1  ORF type:complete len:350 (+),score=58.00 TRINITY_DN409_c1_g2_i1:53-1102(+)
MKYYLLGFSLLVPAAAWFVYWMLGPHYVPGSLHLLQLSVERQDPTLKNINLGDDIIIYQDVVNEDATGTPIFYIHGGPGRAWGDDKSGWSDTIPAGRRAHFYHQRGCGKSSKPLTSLPPNNSFPANSKLIIDKVGFHHDVLDLEKLRIAFGYDKISIVGHSWGGFIASMYAAEFPDRVESLVLSAPAAVIKGPASAEKDFLKVIKSKLLEQGKTDLATGYDEYLVKLMDFGAIGTHTEDSLTKLNNGIGEYYIEAINIDKELLEKDTSSEGAGWSTTGSYVSLGMHHDYTYALKLIKTKTLLIEYENDLMHEELYESIPGVVKIDIPNVTHFPHLENPAALASAILPFV